jgi:hypothetical protein
LSAMPHDLRAAIASVKVTERNLESEVHGVCLGQSPRAGAVDQALLFAGRERRACALVRRITAQLRRKG